MKLYTLERAAKESGVSAAHLKALAEMYADPKRKVVSFWTMGFNQHTRGVWANNLIYNIHLLTGKISEAGNSPFSLTGALASGEATCIDCHKGIAHHLPDMTGVKGWQ